MYFLRSTGLILIENDGEESFVDSGLAFPNNPGRAMLAGPGEENSAAMGPLLL